MDFSTLLRRLAEPLLYPANSHQRIYWLYLLAAVAMALAVYAVQGRCDGDQANVTRRRRGLRRFLGFAFPMQVLTHRSAVVDYLYFIVNKGTAVLLFGPLILSERLVGEATLVSIESTFGLSKGLGWTAGLGTTIAFTLAMALAMDAAMFVTHYLQHKVPALWEFHKVHHSAAVLTPITVYRMHPVDLIVSASAVSLTTGVVHGIFTFLYGHSAVTFAILGLNAVVFVFYLLGNNLRHSHVWLAYPRVLSYLLISPAQHQIHHSSLPHHIDRNFGFIFAFWDWMAGSLYVPRGREALALGLSGGEERAFDSVWQLYTLPFRNLGRRLWPRRAPLPEPSIAGRIAEHAPLPGEAPLRDTR